MEYHDKILKCADCGAEFVFTAGEQMFFADKGFKNEPKRCKSCKSARAQGGSVPAGKKPPSHLSQLRGVPCIAANVFNSGEPWAPRAALLPSLGPESGTDAAT